MLNHNIRYLLYTRIYRPSTNLDHFMTITYTTLTPRVTREDVLAALGDTDPNRTNASAIRAILGRGGNTTIQKLLDEIRAERAAPPVALDTAAPPAAPTALVDAIWSAAWSHAQTLTFARLDRTAAERDQLKASMEVLTSDHEALLADVDELREALAKSEAAIAEQIESEGVKLDAVGEHVQQLSAQLALAQTEVASLRQQLEQAAELARRDAELKDAAHQRDREHLMDQVAELKALLYRRAPDAPSA